VAVQGKHLFAELKVQKYVNVCTVDVCTALGMAAHRTLMNSFVCLKMNKQKVLANKV
jgi:hypothetical protein